MSETDLYKVQVVSPLGNVTYVMPSGHETSRLEDAKVFHDEDDAEEAADKHRHACQGQRVIIMVVPLIEED